jgi:hypothetical protein
MPTGNRVYLVVEQSNDDLDALVQLTTRSAFSSLFPRSSECRE